MSDLAFKVVNRTGDVVAKRRYYDNMFLKGRDGSVVLFIVDAAVIDYPKGRRLKTKRDVLAFDTEAEMLSAVVAGGWLESDGERWIPDTKRVLSDAGVSDG